ncbi:MAG: entericidin [Pseudobdellovibrionaceae bacterium]|jgi:predicted small secreted protein|nr:entericidin [Pseudobdellovibrionaceae bacterium]
MKIKFVILLALGLTTLTLSACGNTLNGAGRDMENWGRAVQNTF